MEKEITYVAFDDCGLCDAEAVNGPESTREQLRTEIRRLAKNMQKRLLDSNEPADITIYRVVEELKDPQVKD